VADADEPECPTPVCVRVTVSGTPGDPFLDFVPLASCPLSLPLARSVATVWGNLDNVAFDPRAGATSLGPVQPVACGQTVGGVAFDSLRPDPGKADFVLSREATQTGYGQSSDGSPRLPSTEPCP
jgi:hypothetical protein